MARKSPKGEQIERLAPTTRAGRPLRPARLKELGYAPCDVDSKGRIRTWTAPDGRALTKYQAYKKLGLPMLNAREWERIDSLEGQERARALRKKGYRLHREKELY